MTPDCREMERRLLEAGERLYDFVPGDPETDGWIAGAGVLVDALFGIGLNAAIQGEALTAVELMNAAAAPTVAADIPSGVEADTGAFWARRYMPQGRLPLPFRRPGTTSARGSAPGRSGWPPSASRRTWWMGGPIPSLSSTAPMRPCPAGPGTPTRGTLDGPISWAAA